MASIYEGIYYKYKDEIDELARQGKPASVIYQVIAAKHPEEAVDSRVRKDSKIRTIRRNIKQLDLSATKPEITQQREEIPTQNEYREKRNNDGSVEITDTVDRKLTDDELFERYGRNKADWRISMVWFKDKREGFLLSCCFIPLLKEAKQSVFRDSLITELKTISPFVPLKKHSATQSGKLLEIDIFDPHFGKLAWGKETGEDYDIDIAEERYMTALSSLLQKASAFEKIDKILFPIGNDLMHTDTVTKTTTAGTPQDVDTRWQKMWLKTRAAVMRGIVMATEVAPVDIVIVPSNHDFQSIFYLGDLLECYYEKNKNITVDNQPKARKYYRYGKCGIGFTHGNEENIKELPMILLRENQKEWSHVEYMEWHIGHWHKKKQLQFVTADDNKGITLRYLRSLSGADAWHYIKGYIGSIKGAESFIWDKEYGITANFMHNL